MHYDESDVENNVIEADVDAALLDIEGRVKSARKYHENGEQHLEILSLEDVRFFIHVSNRGYEVLEQNSEHQNRKFESLHSLLTHFSASYRNQFSTSLADALAGIQQSITSDEEEC